MSDTSNPLPVDEDHSISDRLWTKLHLLVAKPVHRFKRGMTLGSRVAVIDGEGRFLLVKHTYLPGWIFPGGGVERGETCEMAALREVEEEAAVKPTGPLQLHGIFSNHKAFPGDHLAFYVLRQYQQLVFKPNLEIADARFFHADALPQKVNGGTLRRIDELMNSKPPAGEW